MSPWRRPFVARFLAGLLIAALAWTLLPSRAQAHGVAAHRDGDVALVQALAAASHELVAALVVAALVGAAALARRGASGVVLERMTGMSAMQAVVRGLAPMMRGEAAYDAAAVRDGAAALMAHSGDAMTVLFPEDGDTTASFAKPEIWAEWDAFERLSAEPYLYAAGLMAAAPLGRGDAGGGAAAAHGGAAHGRGAPARREAGYGGRLGRGRPDEHRLRGHGGRRRVRDGERNLLELPRPVPVGELTWSRG